MPPSRRPKSCIAKFSRLRRRLNLRLTGRTVDLRVELQAAETLPDLPAPRRSTTELLAASLAAATTSVFGLGMISFGASLSPAVSSIGELQALLSVPILGVVPATDASQNSGRSAARRRAARFFAILSGLLLLLAVAWLLVRS